MLDRRPELVAALLGILETGAAYVPLDPGYPADRLAFLVEDSQVSAVIADDHHADKLPASDLLLLSPSDAGRGEAVSQLATPPDGLAYLIYTSGSTGRPKGVAIRHRSAVAMLQWAAGAFSAYELSGVLAATSINFDISVFELFAPLAHGGRILLAANALALPELPARERVTLLNTVPSAAATLLGGDYFPASISTVNLAGEAVPAELVRSAYRRPGVGRVLNLYGPSEDTTYSTVAELLPGERITVGKPLPGTTGFVVGRDGATVPLGVPGELLLAGRGLARGYLGRPGLTAERFVPDAWSGEVGARALPHGRPRAPAAGRRARLPGPARLPGQAARLPHRAGRDRGRAPRPTGRPPGRGRAARGPARRPRPRRLRGAARRRPARGAELRDALRQRLPEPLVPVAFVSCSTPCRSTPTARWTARAARAERGAARPRELAAPARRSKSWWPALYADLLGVERVGADDHFFELGGHSLLATQLVSRLREAFAVELPVRALFEAPTVAGLAARLERERRSTTPSAVAPPLTAIERRSPAPLSFAQERLWFLDQLEPGSTTYNVPTAVLLSGSLDVGALAEAFSAVVARHESLRTTFATDSGRPVQVISPPSPFLLPVVDLGALSSAEQERELRRLAERHAGEPFDLAHGPLLRAVLARLGTAAKASTGCCSPCTTSSRTAGPWVCWCARSPCSTRPVSRERPRPCRRCRSSTPTSPRGSAAGLAVRCWKPSWPTGGGSWPEPRPCSSCPPTGRGRRCAASAGQASPWASLPS